MCMAHAAVSDVHYAISQTDLQTFKPIDGRYDSAIGSLVDTRSLLHRQQSVEFVKKQKFVIFMMSQYLSYFIIGITSYVSFSHYPGAPCCHFETL